MKDDIGKLDLIKQIEDLTKQKEFLQDKCRQAGAEINELKRDNTLLSYDVATLTNRIQGLEKNVKR
jgi:peptidoglycan hydrolase CwlO-like protein|tara:strand:+ start:40 stop:237 length:198 start_codon:yes stop_codon:yes gene_type:complete